MSTSGRGEPRFGWVLGTGRCGSPLAHEVLCRHPGVGFVSNLEDRLPATAALGRFNGPLLQRVPERFTRKGRMRFAPSEGYRVLDRTLSPVLSSPHRDLTAADATPWLERRVHEWFIERARRQARPVFLHKFTGWPRARFLEQSLPGSRFVHVVRDGRAVASSWLQMDWWLGYRGPWEWHWGPPPAEYLEEWEDSGRSFVVLAGIAWKMLLDAFEEARRELPDAQWLEVRYEDLVADPARRFAEVLEFLGLDGDQRFARALGRPPFRAGRAQAFRADLDGASLAMLEESLRGHLVRFGYAPG